MCLQVIEKCMYVLLVMPRDFEVLFVVNIFEKPHNYL